MKNQFADYDTSKMLKEIGFDEPINEYYAGTYSYHYFLKNNFNMKGFHFDNVELSHLTCEFISAPLWQQVKQWLWEKHDTAIILDSMTEKLWVYKIFKLDKLFICSTHLFDSPITAEIEAIKQAVIHLHKQINP